MTPALKPSVPASPERPANVLLLAAWFGLVAGLSESTVLAFRKWVLDRFVVHNLDLLWMAPVAALALFICLGAVLALGSRLWPRLVTWRVLIGIFGTLTALAAILDFNLLSRAAAGVLAIGLGVTLARLLTSSRDLLVPFARRTLPLLVGAVLLLTALVVGRRWWQDRELVAGLPAARAGLPNVLLIVLDTVGALHLSLYHYHRPTTPRLESFAKQGTRFERAFATAPWTLPSHASMFTGRWAHELSTDWQTGLDGTHQTLAEALGGRGYLSAGFVANSYCGRGLGLARGFAHYEDFPITPPQILFSSALGRLLVPSYKVRLREVLKSADDINHGLLRWLDGRDDRRPFFAFLNYMDAHDPYDPPPPFDTVFTDRESLRRAQELNHNQDTGWTAAQVAAASGAYDGSVAYLDAKLGELFQELERRGLLDQTLVIVTGDHGEQFGQHGIFHHGNSLYNAVMHVPLVMRLPGRVPTGDSVLAPISLHDLAATIMDLTDSTADSHRLPGRSLARHWRATNPAAPPSDSLLMEVTYSPRLPEGTPVSRGSMQSLLVGSYKLIRNGDGVEELYHVETDPAELHDLVSDSSVAVPRAALRSALDDMVGRGNQ